MTLILSRIDDRLIHGQVVVGWGQPLGIGFIVLVDDDVAANEWEQELYRAAVPPDVDVYFHSADQVVAGGSPGLIAGYRADRRRGILLTGGISTMQRLVDAGLIDAVNLGGIHHRAGRVQRMRYVFLTREEEQRLEAIAARGVPVTAQDVPGARAVPLSEVIAGTSA